MIIKDFWVALQKGKQLANVETWKNRTIASGIIVSLLTAIVAIGKAFGYDFGIDAVAIESIGLAIASIASLFFAASTAATSTKVGMQAKPESNSESPDDRPFYS